MQRNNKSLMILSIIYDTVLKYYVMTSDQDMNANVGVSKNKKNCNQIGISDSIIETLKASKRTSIKNSQHL